MRIGLIGLGAIGSFLVQNLPEHEFLVFDVQSEKAQKTILEKKIQNATLASNLKDLEGSDLVVEAASQEAVSQLEPFLTQSDVLVMSVSAFTDEALWTKLKRAAEKKGHTVFIPSGAVGGLEVLQSCQPTSVTLETRKNPKSLDRTDEKETVVFDGSAREACQTFPQNVNVAATLSLAGIGLEKTRVRVVSDPQTKNNTHTVRIEGKTGSYCFTFQNTPLEQNPRTSALAAYSALWAVKREKHRIKVG